MSKYIIGIILLSFSEMALSEYAISAYEIQRMPPFCRGLSAGNFQADAQAYRKSIRAPGKHFQHFCHGMKFMLRAQRADFKKNGSGKKLYLRAIGEFDYILGKKKDNRKTVLALVHMQKALALSHLDDSNAAINEYLNAITLKGGNYPYAYKKLAQYYFKLGAEESALETINKGLKYAPGDRSLNKLLKKLKGKE